jgi:hypothetical protein
VSVPLAIKRCAIVAPVVVPAFKPTVYGEFLVHFTVTVVAPSVWLLSGSTVGKVKLTAETLHCALTLAWTWNVVVIAVANAPVVAAISPAASSARCIFFSVNIDFMRVLPGWMLKLKKWNLGISGRHRAATVPRPTDLLNQLVMIDSPESAAGQGQITDGKQCRSTTYA